MRVMVRHDNIHDAFKPPMSAQQSSSVTLLLQSTKRGGEGEQRLGSPLGSQE